jgi:hypothetical protein
MTIFIYSHHIELPNISDSVCYSSLYVNNTELLGRKVRYTRLFRSSGSTGGLRRFTPLGPNINIVFAPNHSFHIIYTLPFLTQDKDIRLFDEYIIATNNG